MTRRERHNQILIGTTIVLIAVGGYSLLMVRDVKVFFIACGIYTVFLLLYSVVCWLDVPNQLRRIPGKPVDFDVVRLGPITVSTARFLGEAQIIRDQTFSSKRHQLFRVERAYPEGTWRFEIEVADDQVLAMATSYESIESPALDRGDQIGEGRFLVIPGSV